MKIAKRFELFPAVASDPRVRIKARSKEVPLMVAVVLDWDRVILTREIKHHETVFIDDRFHDWDFDKEAGELRYYSHALPSAIMAESCGDDVERMPIIVIYEFEQ